MTEDQMGELFREMRDEPLPADSLARVRLGVEQRIGKRSWVAAWKIAATLVVAGSIVAGFLLLRPARTPVRIEPPSMPEIAQVIPPAESPVPPERPAVRVARPKRVRPRPVENVPVLIRIETADPDVVILLVN